MIKKYELYLAKVFLRKIVKISALFLSLIFILNIFDEISFFNDLKVNFLFPFLLSIINTPTIIFEIFPFIFLISSQFFFIEIFNKNELEFLKINGLNNLKIIKVLFLTSLLIGLTLPTLYYSFSSKLKFLYLDLKNSYSKDDKYLAVVKESGLWIKDEINEKIYIVNANKIEGDFLKNVTINEFNINFNLERRIESANVDISKMSWIIAGGTIFHDNTMFDIKEKIIINTHFNTRKIRTLFKNLTSLNMIELIKLRKQYKSLNYSTSEVDFHLHKLYSFPLYLSIMTVLSSIIMLNIKRNTPVVFHIILGVMLSVLIYYFYYLSSLLGINGKIPLAVSVYLPLLILTLIIAIGLIKVNEK